MNLFFRKETMGDRVNLILDIQKEDKMDMFALNMIGRNRIEPLIPVQLSQFNNEHFLQYDITGKSTLAGRLSHTLKKAEVEKLLNSIIAAFEEVEAYMLSDGCLHLDWNYIFTDEEDNCFFMYLPFEEESTVDKMRFFQNMVEQIQEDYTERENYIYDIRNAFSRGAVKKIADLKDLLKKNYTTSVGAVEEKVQNPVQAVSASVNTMAEQAVAPKAAEEKKPAENKGFSFSLPGKEKEKSASALNIPGKEKSTPVMNIPGKENASPVLNIPGKDKSSPVMNIPGKENAASVLNIPGKEDASFALPSKSGIPLNIPGKASTVEVKKVEEKEVKKKLDVKLPEINLFGKKVQTKETAPEVTMESVLQAKQQEREKKNEDMYESYEHTVIMEAPKVEDVNSAVVGQQAPAKVAKLLRKNTSETVVIDKNSFTMGSGNVVDYCIMGNKTISRGHAMIQKQGDAYCFMDNNSSNGSFVNGRRVAAGEQVRLEDGYVIRLSDEDFVFQLS